MMKKKLIIICVVCVLFGYMAFGATLSVDEANKVDRTLKKIAKSKRYAVIMKKVTFTENELNSYLNVIYNKKYASEIKSIDLKLSKNNYASGIMKIELHGKKYTKVPSFLRDIEVEFYGKIECETYRMRYNFETLKVNGKSFSPELLDEAFGAAQVNYKVKKSLFDWFELLPGIKNIILNDKSITLFY